MTTAQHKSLYAPMARHVMAPVLDVIRGTHTMRCLRELEESEWWPLDRIEELQRARLGELIGRAFESVPHYRRIMHLRGVDPSRFQSVEDLVLLPILTKALIQEDSQDLVSTHANRDELVSARTGGSTGSPLAFYTTREDRHNRGLARVLRADSWAGIQMGDKRISVRVIRRESELQQRVLKTLSARLRRTVQIGITTLSEESIPTLLDLIRRMQPRVLGAYPSILTLIAMTIRDSGIEPPAIPVLLTGGEQLFPHQRELLREVFATEPYSRYSSYEAYEIASECPAHAGLHINMEDIVVEVVDDEGIPVPQGTQGRILITNLHNHSMPLIRYENGDIGSIRPIKCPCGRQSLLLDLQVGRTGDFIYTPSGKRVAGIAIGLSRFAALGVTQCQVVQDRIDCTVVRVVTPSADTEAKKKAVTQGITEILTGSLGNDMQIEVVFLKQIEATPMGKHIHVVSKIDPNSWLKKDGAADAK